MTDVFTPEKRKWIMGRVRSRNTAPELVVRSVIHRMGFRFRLHVRDLPGVPDIVMPKHRKAVFVNGCFWHAHPGCPRAALPKTNAGFWERKISGNAERDGRNMEAMKSLGWDVLVVWSCEVRRPEVLLTKLSHFLLGGPG
jgi:DNA mismatch endonuclease (patch repair protein)